MLHGDLGAFSPTHARHLLRALLREATYLPDAAARTFVRSRILSRFRDYTPLPDNVTQQRIERVFLDAEKQLRALRRANAGERDVLLKVLEYTYGRRGPRRYELLKPLLKANASSDLPDGRTGGEQEPDKVTPTLKVPHGLAPVERTPDGYLKFQVRDPKSKLQATLASQELREKGQHRNLSSKLMAGTNNWGWSMPRKRQKNFVKKWWNKTMLRALPPLKAAEQKRLYKLATGKLAWAGPPERRSRRHPMTPEMDMVALQAFVKSGSADLLTAASQQGRSAKELRLGKETTQSQSHNSNGNTTTNVLDNRSQSSPDHQLPQDAGHIAARKDLLLKDALGIRTMNKNFVNHRDQGHNITHRFMRRLWAQVLEKSPVATWDEATSQWDVEWTGESIFTGMSSKNLKPP